MLIDAIGQAHEPARGPARIVSLVPSITELLFDLGLDGQLVGRTSFCVHPKPGVDSIARVGGTKTVRLDRLRRLRPTHAIVNVDENQRSDYEEIATFVPSVVVTHPLDPLDNLHLYRLLGGLFGRSRAAEALCGRFEREHGALLALRERLPRARVLYLIWRSPWMSVAASTYIARTLELVGWRTVFEDDEPRYPSLEPDTAALGEVELVLFSSEPFPFKLKHTEEFASTFERVRAPWSFIDAEMVSWYGSRAVAGLGYLGRLACRLAPLIRGTRTRGGGRPGGRDAEAAGRRSRSRRDNPSAPR